jgi:hypothetical protein
MQLNGFDINSYFKNLWLPEFLDLGVIVYSEDKYRKERKRSFIHCLKQSGSIS